MQLKPIAAITVLLLVVVSLSIAGCTSSPQTNVNPSVPAKMNTTENTTKNVTSNVTKAAVTATVTPTATEQPTATPVVTKESTTVTVVGSHSVSTADKVSKSGSHSFTATINPSAVCGDLQWNINGIIIGTSNGCGGSTITVSIMNQPGIQVGHTYQLTAYFAGNENYGSSYDTAWIYIEA